MENVLKSSAKWASAGFISCLALSFAFKKDPPPMSIAANVANNVLYQRTDNPMTILTHGIAEEDLRIEGQNVKLIKIGDYRYHAICHHVGEASITISDGKGLSQTFPFRVKRVPDPELLLGQRFYAGPIKANDFKNQQGFFFPRHLAQCEPRCTLTTYDLTLLRGHSDAVTIKDSGMVFSAKTQAFIKTARSGDTFYFENRRCKCPGGENRAVDPLIFSIR
jgi:hypothetical protein